MKVNFEINQGDFLGNYIDPEIKSGVCSAMTIAWLKRELSGKSQSSMNYYNIHEFTSRQRAMGYRYCAPGQFSRLFKSDNLTRTALGTINKSNIIQKITPYMPGVFMVDIYSHSGGAHCVGLSILNDKYKFFDPNSGEHEVEGNTTNHPLLDIMSCFYEVLIWLRYHQIRINKIHSQ